jgi:imidazolonepropionase-like amidohydrolase
LAILFLLPPSAAGAQDLVVHGETVYPVAGPPIEDGVVVIRGGRIAALGPAAEVALPEGVPVVRGKVVTPGLIDAHSVVGLAGIYNQPHDQDQLDKGGPIQPELRALDAYNPREDLVAWVRSLGVTVLHTGPAPGALTSGQTLIVKTRGETVEEALLDPAQPVSAVAVTLGPQVGRNFDSPGSRAKGAALLRAELVKAREYVEKRASMPADKQPARDLRLEALAEVLRGDRPALVTAQRATEIMTALRLARELGFRLVLDGAAEAYLVLDEIRAAGVPVILHPTMVRATGETANVSFETASRLAAAGIPFAFQSGYEGYVPKSRVVLFEAAVAVAHGLPFDRALKALTLDAAVILGIDRRVGSLEVGKDGDVVVFDGDPFEYTSHVCAVVIDGRLEREGCR